MAFFAHVFHLSPREYKELTVEERNAFVEFHSESQKR